MLKLKSHNLFPYPLSALTGGLGLILLAVPLRVCADDVMLARAKQLVDANRAASAYDILVAQEADAAGDSEFDYLLGVAALESRKPEHAVFALERAVATNPRFGGARVALARAYYSLGEYAQSKNEFETVLSLQPPPEVRQVTRRYLKDIKAKLHPLSSHVNAYLELGVGSDSNANSAAAIDSFLGITLSPDSKETASSVLQSSFGIQAKHPVGANLALVAGGDYAHYGYPQAAFVDSDTGKIDVAVHKSAGDRSFNVGLGLQQINVDGVLNNRGAYLSAEGSRATGRQWRTDGSLRFGAVRYSETFEIKDTDQLVLGLRVSRTNNANAGITSASLLAGTDMELADNSPYGRDYFGMRLSQVAVGLPKTTVFGALGLLNSHYKGRFFGSHRDDTQFDVTLGATITPAKRWHIQPLINYLRNNSDVALYDYKRLNASVAVKRFLL